MYDRYTMIPAERRCEFCNGKMDKSKRADARFCQHACKLAARRQTQRDEATKQTAAFPPLPEPPVVHTPLALPPRYSPTELLPLPKPRVVPDLPVLSPPPTPRRSRPRRTTALVRPPTPLVAEFIDKRYVQHPTRRPLTLAELEEVLLMNAHPSAEGYRLGILIDTPKRGPRLYLYPAELTPTQRSNGTVRSDGMFRLRPFEAPVIPMIGIYEVRYKDGYGFKVRGGQGVANGLHLQPYGFVANIKDGDSKRPK